MSHGATILGCADLELSRGEAAFFREADPLGFILFARNVGGPEQLRRLTGDLRAAVGRDAPVLIDQEGGRVARMLPPNWREWLPPLSQMAMAGQARAARSMYLRYRLIAAELRDVGIDVNCAPVADIASQATHAFLRNRCYGEDLPTVLGAARAVAQGLLAGGVVPVVKHMPGHGRGAVDSHYVVPVVYTDAPTLKAQDFAAFRGLSDLPMGMTAHVVFAALDAEAPATLSSRMIDVVRQDIGFDGLLMTDDISMEALPGAVGARADKAIRAGCDVVLHCNGDRSEMEAVVRASGRLNLRAAARAERALAARSQPDHIDLAGIEAELGEIVPQAAIG